ncbi:hypothetical protein ACFLYU_05110 [Candidatus Dependentiae bacterium]
MKKYISSFILISLFLNISPCFAMRSIFSYFAKRRVTGWKTKTKINKKFEFDGKDKKAKFKELDTTIFMYNILPYIDSETLEKMELASNKLKILVGNIFFKKFLDGKKNGRLKKMFGYHSLKLKEIGALTKKVEKAISKYGYSWVSYKDKGKKKTLFLKKDDFKQKINIMFKKLIKEPFFKTYLRRYQSKYKKFASYGFFVVLYLICVSLNMPSKISSNLFYKIIPGAGRYPADTIITGAISLLVDDLIILPSCVRGLGYCVYGKVESFFGNIIKKIVDKIKKEREELRKTIFWE